MCVYVKLLMTALPTLHIETVPRRVRKKRYIIIDSEESDVKFKQPSLLLCSELPWQSYPKSVLREDESSLLSVPTNMKIGGVSDFSDIFLVF